MSLRKCINCDFCFVEDDIAHNQCRRHAPRPGAVNPETSGWPRVKSDDWCGEFSFDRGMSDNP